MKTIILYLVFILSSFVTFSQEELRSYAVQIGHWNSIIKDYQWESIKDCDVIFTVINTVIVADDEAESKYYTYANFYQKDKVTSWYALDEQRRKCTVSMVFGKTFYFIVAYDNDVCFKYFINI
jgi:hypothetical protein